MNVAPHFTVVGSIAASAVLRDIRMPVIAVVEATYRAHAIGAATNPNSQFLTFPDHPNSRIISLPARVAIDQADVAGIKWISSFPDNLQADLPRATSVIVLNDMSTGFPFALVESSHVSAARTAASAALAVRHLFSSTGNSKVGLVGAGPIGRTIVEYLIADGHRFEELLVFDLDQTRAAECCKYFAESIEVCTTTDAVETLTHEANLIIFATSALVPYIHNPAMFESRHTVLHVSLRDLGVPVVLGAQNIVDDIEHCLKAQTSLHLAEQQAGHREFVSGSIVDLMDGRIEADPTKPRIFSPFGMGILDVAVANAVFKEARARNSTVEFDDFFSAVLR